MTSWHVLFTLWDWEPSVVLGCSALVLAYTLATRLCWPRRAAYFGAGTLVLLLALVSPIDTLGDEYLFSAHMLQHLLLLLVVPQLWLLGIPVELLERAKQIKLVAWGDTILGQPALAWVLGMGTLWIWHLPFLYDAALESEAVHILEHLCILVTATIFWWPVVAPQETRMSPPAALIYLMAAAMVSTLLGILLAFAPTIVYRTYIFPRDSFGILSLLRDSWGLSPRADQEIAGLLMWVPGSFAYLAAILATMLRWLDASELDDVAREFQDT